MPTPGRSPGRSPPPTAPAAGGLFSPQSKSLGIDLTEHGPTVLEKIVYAGSNAPSLRRGSEDLLALAEVAVKVKQVERLTELIGKERPDERDAAVAAAAVAALECQCQQPGRPLPDRSGR